MKEKIRFPPSLPPSHLRCTRSWQFVSLLGQRHLKCVEFTLTQSESQKSSEHGELESPDISKCVF